MKRTMTILMAVMTLASVAAVASADSITLNPSGDAGIQLFSWNTGDENWGDGNDLWSGSISTYGGYAYSLIKWDFSGIPSDAIVTSATLRMYYSYPLTDGNVATGRACDFYQMDGGWNEMTVTHNNRPSEGDELFTFNVTAGTAAVPSWMEWSSEDLNTWVSSAISDNTLADYGWYMGGPTTANTGATLGSRESAYVPQLVIEYIPEPATMGLLGLGGLALLRRRRR